MDGPEKKGVFICTVNNFINYINVSAIVNGTSIVTKTAMQIIKERLTQLDNEEFVHELFNDSNNINGNKLRAFRLFKNYRGQSVVLRPCSVAGLCRWPSRLVNMSVRKSL